MGVYGRLISFLWFVEAETVAPTVSGAVQLLQQKDHCLMDDSQHPQSVNTWEEQRQTPTMSQENLPFKYIICS